MIEPNSIETAKSELLKELTERISSRISEAETNIVRHNFDLGRSKDTLTALRAIKIQLKEE